MKLEPLLRPDSFSLVSRIAVTSTMDSAREFVLEAGPLPAVIVAEEQTAGRGRNGRTWYSPREKGIYLTVILPQRVRLPQYSGFSLAVGVVLSRSFSKLGIPHRLKWPNDVLAPSGRKLAGILIEATSQEILVGIGINTAMSPELEEQNGEAISNREPELLFQTVLENLDEVWSNYETFAPLRDEWLERSELSRALVTVDGKTGTCIGVDESGALLLRQERETVRIVSGDIEVRDVARD